MLKFKLEDLRSIQPNLEDTLNFYTSHLTECGYSSGPWLCGGFWRRALSGNYYLKECPDLDYFFHTTYARLTFESRIMNDGYELKFESDDAKLWINKKREENPGGNCIIHVQTIMKPYSSLKECLSSFDYTICQFGWDGEFLHTSVDALHDLTNMVLNPTGQNPKFTRLRKFTKQGYRMSQENYFKFLMNVDIYTELGVSKEKQKESYKDV